jgi:hypothetical protein
MSTTMKNRTEYFFYDKDGIQVHRTANLNPSEEEVKSIILPNVIAQNGGGITIKRQITVTTTQTSGLHEFNF